MAKWKEIMISLAVYSSLIDLNCFFVMIVNCSMLGSVHYELESFRVFWTFLSSIYGRFYYFLSQF